MLVKINWEPNRKEIRNFGLFMLALLPLFGALVAWKFDSWKPLIVCAILGAAAGVLSICLPPAGRLLYRGWMGIAFAMAAVFTPIVMGAIYFGVFTPMGFVLRLAGRDSMQRRRKAPGDGGYWVAIDHRSDVRSYERQF